MPKEARTNRQDEVLLLAFAVRFTCDLPLNLVFAWLRPGRRGRLAYHPADDAVETAMKRIVVDCGVGSWRPTLINPFRDNAQVRIHPGWGTLTYHHCFRRLSHKDRKLNPSPDRIQGPLAERPGNPDTINMRIDCAKVLAVPNVGHGLQALGLDSVYAGLPVIAWDR